MTYLKPCYLALIGVFFLFAIPSHGQIKLLNPLDQPRFATPLPRPAVIDAINGTKKDVYEIEMKEIKQDLGLIGINGKSIKTRVWAYDKSYPGPTFLVMRDQPINVEWKNMLPSRHLFPIDESIHWAHPDKHPRGGIPTVAHLHGGHTEPESDGHPEAWFTRGYDQTGASWTKKIYHYDNDQEAATLWYHDHTLGITRLNVNAGLAGFYLLRDQNEMDLIERGVLPSGDYEREIVIQDRMFDASGNLFFPSHESHPGGEGLPPGVPVPSAIAEFFGDFILVNGTIWPYMKVEPRKYCFRLLNGSDSRFYILKFSNRMQFYQVDTEDGLLNRPVTLKELLIAPGERADVVVDFSLFRGGHIELLNLGPDGPFKGLNRDGTLNDGEGGALPRADPATTGKIMQFTLAPLNREIPDATVNYTTNLRPIHGSIRSVGIQTKTRRLGLFEGQDEFGRLQPMLGIIDRKSPLNGSLTWSDPITENPMVNDVEVWEIYNTTEDAHPIHLHMVAFQILSRESIAEMSVRSKEQVHHNGTIGEGGIIDSYTLAGDWKRPAPNEAGWKDTAIAPPGMVTRVVAKFDRPGEYVWHCHILSHEDHDMMRRFYVGERQARRSQLEVDRPVASSMLPDTAPVNVGPINGSMYNGRLGQNYPNPFQEITEIPFQLTQEEHVVLQVFDLHGRLIAPLADQDFAAGEYEVTWDGRNTEGHLMPAGMYIYHFQAGNKVESKRLLIVR